MIAPIRKSTSIDKAHDMLGHFSEAATHTMAKLLGWKIQQGPMRPCQACAIAKAHQCDLPGQPNLQAAVPVEEEVRDGKNRMFLDIQTGKPREGMKPSTTPVWRIMVDQRTRMKFTSFHAMKDGMVEPTVQQLQAFKRIGRKVEVIQMDNAGENKALEDKCKSSEINLGIDFEQTGRNMPQRNSLAETGLATIAARG